MDTQVTDTDEESSFRPEVDATKLWAGGIATAIVAGLVATASSMCCCSRRRGRLVSLGGSLPWQPLLPCCFRSAPRRRSRKSSPRGR